MMEALQLLSTCLILPIWLCRTDGNDWLQISDVIHSSLEGPPVWTAKVMNKFQCESLCVKLKSCSSASYDPQRRVCQTVGSSTKSSQYTHGLIHLKEPRLFPQHSPCASYPCPQQTVCAVVTPPSGYRCLGIVPEAECSTPDALENGNFTYTDTKFNSVLIYNCDVGYNFSGNSNIAVCGALGQWRGFSGKCQIIDCDEPAHLLHGNRSFNLTTYGENAIFFCNTGYNFSSSDNVATCGSSGVWEGVSGQCEKITCSAPVALPKANHFFNNSTYGAVVAYNCSTGYNFTGESNRATCSASGRWEGLDGQCNLIDCGSATSLNNSSSTFTTTTYGSVAVYTCNIGYNFSGNSNRASCNVDGTWNGVDGICQIVDCGVPGEVADGNVTYDESTYGSIAVYTCNVGFNYTGIREGATCDHTGLWQGRGTCQLIDCGPPTSLNNSSSTFTTTTYGSVAVYTCNIGYNFSGNRNRASCNVDGTWNGVDGICQIVDCGVPGEVADGNVTYDESTYGSIAVYTCNVGFNYTGIREGATCDHTGLWQGRGTCQLVDCGAPPVVENANATYTTTTFTANVTYGCHTDYVFTGTTLDLACTQTGVWIGMDGLCVEYFVNIAADKHATQLSTYGSATADKALSGKCADGNYVNKPWWKVDLGSDYKIDHLRAKLRGDCCASRMTTLTNEVQSSNGASTTTCPRSSGSITAGSVLTYNCAGKGSFRYVTFKLTVTSAMTLCDVRVYIINPLL
ncbi:sushi, von Willebrand factor type A, EGF and pentraxin domain-containing protein 1-like [Haliotis rubra]|uniref:sushi, von Willebrand factor type A, EGF and pentraxin domain-containing protein 1-like n=1 Tax=Haliotis rubra TaxID=36100 RepID=UPI001EE60E69|nr:sushi, von Willebrand factor type A, EGF and pentraxin domain-containing protein 1-like [Haliotis rubra]